MSEEAEDIVRILTAAGFDAEVMNGDEFPKPTVPITEAVKSAPKHWP